MKRVLSLLLILTTAMYYSCGEDEEGSGFGDLPEDLVGSWSSVMLTSTGCSDSGDNGSCSVGCLTITFTSEGLFSGQFYGEVISGTVTANENTLNLCDDSGFCNEITYSEDGDLVNINWKDSEDGCSYSGTIAEVGFPSELVGTWNSDNASATGCDDSEDDGSCEDNCLSYTFDSSGIFHGTLASEPERTGFGYVSNSILYLCWSQDFSCQAVSYEVTDGSGTVTWDDNEDGCKYAASITRQ